MKPTSLKQHNWRRLMALWYSMAHWRVLKTSLHNQYQYQCVSIDSLAKHNCSWSRLSSNKAVDSQTTPMMQWWISKKFHHSIWYNFNEFHWWVQWTGKLLYATHQAEESEQTALHTFVKTSREQVMIFCVVWFSNLLHTIVRWSCTCNNVGQKPLHDFGNVVFGRKALKGQHQLSWKPLRNLLDDKWMPIGHYMATQDVNFYKIWIYTYAVWLDGM